MQKATAIQPIPSLTLGARLRALLDLRYLAAFTVLATYVLIVIGGTVRATDSGTACPDWPLCHGRLIPQAETHVLIEYSHRLAASFVGLLIAAVVITIWRRERTDRVLLRAGIVAVAVLVVQVIAGGVTVNTETNATVVAVHLSIALSLLATLIFIAGRVCLTRLHGRAEDAADGRPISWLPFVTVAAILALILTGAYVSQEGAGLAYPDWPLFDGKLTSAGGKLANLHYMHRMTAALVGVLVAALMVRTLRRERRPVILYAMTLAFVVFVAQVLVGASNVWLELATSVRIIHLALASALWGVLVFTIVWAYLLRITPAPKNS